MNSNKLVLMTLAVVAIGIFALPSTVSMFGGQHNWYDLGDPENDVPCQKCHADIYDEFKKSGVHKTLAGGDGSNSSYFGTNYDIDDACGACHRTTVIYTLANGSGDASIPGEEAHAAISIACMYCHNYENATYYAAAPYAGGFTNKSNTTFIYNSTTNPGTLAAHNEFVQGAIDDDMMEEANEACIACHTHVATDILWTHAYKMNFTASGVGGVWTVYNFTSEGNYTVLTYGNMTGNTTGVSNVTVTISPTPPGYDETNP